MYVCEHVQHNNKMGTEKRKASALKKENIKGREEEEKEESVELLIA